jgi:hypothetical protein
LVAVADAPQVSVRLEACPVALLAGAVNTGAAGPAMPVVKLNVLEYALVPAAFVALTRQ